MGKKNLTAIYDLIVSTIEIQLQKFLLISKQGRMTGIIGDDVEFFTEHLNSLAIIKNQNRLLTGYDYHAIFQQFVNIVDVHKGLSVNLSDDDDGKYLVQKVLEIIYDAENDMTIWFRENEDTITYMPIEESISS